MKYPLVRELAAEGIPVAVTSRVLGFSRQAFYVWDACPVSDTEWRQAHLMNAIVDAHAADPEFGYRLLADELEKAGLVACENTVHALCKAAGVTARMHKKKGTGRKAGPPVHDDLVQRKFTAAAPNRLWLTDITEHPTSEGKLYVCAVKDVFAGRIVGYAIGPRMTSQLAVGALEDAVARRSPANGTVVHSDRGSQFRSQDYLDALEKHGLAGSMGRVGAAGDNAAMESFFGLLENNVLTAKRTWETRRELRTAIVAWIETVYHRRRRQRRLKRMTPVEYEAVFGHPSQLTLAA